MGNLFQYFDMHLLAEWSANCVGLLFSMPGNMQHGFEMLLLTVRDYATLQHICSFSECPLTPEIAEWSWIGSGSCCGDYNPVTDAFPPHVS